MDSVGVNTPNFEAGQVSFSKKMDCENWLIAVLLEPWASSVQRAAVAYTIQAACKTANINHLEYLAGVILPMPTRKANDVDDL